jgi:hypothetical protein
MQSFDFMLKTRARWRSALRQSLVNLVLGQSASERLAGDRSFDRASAGYLLAAMVPFVPLIAADRLGWSRGVLHDAWTWLSCAWAALIAIVLLWDAFEAVGEALRRRAVARGQ